MAGYGTLSTMDTLLAMRNTTVEDYGLDEAYASLEELRTSHNEIMTDMVSSLCEFTADKIDSYGGAANGQMTEADEFGSPDVQKVSQGVDVGFPLKGFQYAVGWTDLYMKNKTMAEWAGQINGAFIAHRLKVESEIKKAIFTPTNNLTYKDKRVRGTTLPIRAFLNADGTEIPPDPWGQQFNAGTHTHYIGTASFVQANLQAGIAAIREHYNTGAVQVDINQAQEAAVRAFPLFQPYVDNRIRQSQTTSYAEGSLDIMNIYNRPIGILDGAEIWVKSWTPAQYVFFYNPFQNKPLKFRTRTGTWAGLTLAAAFAAYPLYANFFVDEFGISVFERANGAALKTDNATYATPAGI